MNEQQKSETKLDEMGAKLSLVAGRLEAVLQRIEAEYAEAVEREKTWALLRVERERHEMHVREAQLRMLEAGEALILRHLALASGSGEGSGAP